MRKVYSPKWAAFRVSNETKLTFQIEIDQITRRRTTYETSLVKQRAQKDDFFKYAEYEINLERMRKIRWKRLGEIHQTVW